MDCVSYTSWFLDDGFLFLFCWWKKIHFMIIIGLRLIVLKVFFCSMISFFWRLFCRCEAFTGTTYYAAGHVSVLARDELLCNDSIHFPVCLRRISRTFILLFLICYIICNIKKLSVLFTFTIRYILILIC